MTFSDAVLALLTGSLAFGTPVDKAATKNSTINWAPCDLDLPSTLEAVIAAQKTPFYCATIKVPLDYTNERNGRTIDLQLIQVKATKQPVKGTILAQPGGPGGSGVEDLIEKGPTVVEIFGGQWDVVAFDPRGTGRTLPFTCNTVNSTASALSRRSANYTIPQADMYKILREKAWHDAGLYTEACGETESLADFANLISTPFAARDMLKVVDALGGDGMLRLWGRSYGTILGQTFAAMFPDRVERLVLDSVVKLDEYYSGQWTSVNRDTEVALRNFFKECIAAGVTNCPIANFTGPGTTVDTLHKALGDGFRQLLHDNIILPKTLFGAWWQPGTTLYQEYKYYLLTMLYNPTQFGTVYAIADTILNRNWTASDFDVPPPATPPEKPWDAGVDAFHGIACADMTFRTKNPEDLYSTLKAQGGQGSFMDIFGPQLWPCAQWPWTAQEQFKGPFSNIKTKNPVLMINSPNDPITPLSGAWEASANFVGSHVLVHNGHGHGSFNHPSKCTRDAIKDYFNDGKVPEQGKVCETDQTAYEVFLEFAEATANSTGQQQNTTRRGLDLRPRKLFV